VASYTTQYINIKAETRSLRLWRLL